MNTSATITDPLLRRAFGRRACPSDLTELLGTGALLFGGCHRLRAAGQATPQTAEPVLRTPRAGLATQLSDFATNCHE